MREYPDEEEVEKVRTWEFTKEHDFRAFMEYVKSIGNYWPEEMFGWSEDGAGIYHVSTGGWSGNEEILGAMQENLTFWMVCWYSSRRGGHYEFRLPDPETYWKP